MTADEEAELREKISDAKAEYHALMIGTKARVFVDQNGERVEFVSANRGYLLNYITQLEALLPGAPPAAFVAPIRFLF